MCVCKLMRAGVCVYVLVRAGTIPLTSSCGVRGSYPLLPFLSQSVRGETVNRGGCGGDGGGVALNLKLV